MRHRQQRVARRLRLLQQLHRGVTTYQSNVVECHPCAEGDFRPIRRSRHVGDRQWHPVCIGRVRRICENVEFRPRYIFTEIPAVKRQGRERGQDSEQLFTKCRQSGQSELQALLDWRNTPTEGLQTSPAR